MKNIPFKLLIFIFMFGLEQNGEAQSTHLLQVGLVDSIFSSTLNETREIYIQMPDGYEPGSQKKYPVIYVLDGEVLLNVVSEVHNFYWGGYMPEMIIVGISNKNHRTRDLTTSEIETRHGVEFRQEHGGAEKFTAFFKDELFPYIEKNYPATEYRTLIGHSYAGLFVINALMNHSDLFDNYLAIDPSLDWDQQDLLNQSKSIFPEKNLKGKSLFMSLGGQLHMQNSDINLNNVMEDSSEFTLFARSNIEFSNLIKSNPQSELVYKWEFYENDIHGTVPVPSILDGLVFIFKWYQMEHTDKFNNPETPMAELVKIIRAREEKLRSHFGYDVPPYDQDLLNMLGYMNLEMEQPQKSLTFFKLCIEYFPHSPNAYDSLADYFIAQNDIENALLNLSRAFDLSGDEFYRKKMKELNSQIN